MSTVESPAREPATTSPREEAWPSKLRREPSRRTTILCLLGLAAVSFAVRTFLVLRVHAPLVFSDELGYEKLAQSIGRAGRFALFNNPGLSYSPLYSVVLSPIYALGASAPHGYTLIKVVNALLLSLSVVPTFLIARFVLPRRAALGATAVMIAAPLMLYTSFSMSENIAYPLALVAIWAMLEAARAPGSRTDAILAVSILAATAARVQLFVLVPAAVTALLVAPILVRDRDRGARARVLGAIRAHLLLIVAGIAGLVALGGAAVAGRHVSSAAGRYSVVLTSGFPNVGHFLNVALRHVAGLEFAVAVIPFVAAIVATCEFFSSARSPRTAAFAAVASAVTVWIVFEVAFDAALFDLPDNATGPGDAARVHERFMIYLVPLFVVTLFATLRRSFARVPDRLYLAAAGVAALLPLAIPFGTVVNITINVDTFSFQPFSRVTAAGLGAASHATLLAVWMAGTLSLVYARFRTKPRLVVGVVVATFLGISIWAGSRIEDGGNFARATLPQHANWVDRTNPGHDVVLVTGAENATSALETAYFNQSITRVYYVCRGAMGPEFGETKLEVAPSGLLHDASGAVHASKAIVPWSFGVVGRVVTWNGAGGQVLVAPPKGPLRISPPKIVKGYCPRTLGSAPQGIE